MSLRSSITSEKIIKKFESKRNASGSKVSSTRNWGEDIQEAVREFPDGTVEVFEYNVEDLIDSKKFYSMVQDEVRAIIGDPKELLIVDNVAYRAIEEEDKVLVKNFTKEEKADFIAIDFEANKDEYFEEVQPITGVLLALFDEAVNTKNMSHTRYLETEDGWYRIQVGTVKDDEVSKMHFMKIA